MPLPLLSLSAVELRRKFDESSYGDTTDWLASTADSGRIIFVRIILCLNAIDSRGSFLIVLFPLPMPSSMFSSLFLLSIVFLVICVRRSV